MSDRWYVRAVVSQQAVWRAALAYSGDQTLATAATSTMAFSSEASIDPYVSVEQAFMAVFDRVDELIEASSEFAVFLIDFALVHPQPGKLRDLIAGLEELTAPQRRLAIVHWFGRPLTLELSESPGGLSVSDLTSTLESARTRLGGGDDETIIAKFETLHMAESPASPQELIDSSLWRRRIGVGLSAVGVSVAIWIVSMAGAGTRPTASPPATTAGNSPATATTGLLAERRADLELKTRDDDRETRIAVSQAGEVVRRHPDTDLEMWRSEPLGNIEVFSVDPNSVTVVRKLETGKQVKLYLSLSDGTLLPP